MQIALPTGTRGEEGIKHGNGVPPPIVGRLGAIEVEVHISNYMNPAPPQYCACPDLLVDRDFTESDEVMIKTIPGIEDSEAENRRRRAKWKDLRITKVLGGALITRN